MSLTENDDTIRNTSAIRVIENSLLTNQLANNQELLIGTPPSSQKGGAVGYQGINTGQIPLEMAQLLVDRLKELVDAGSLLLLLLKSLRLGTRPGIAFWPACGPAVAYGQRHL